MGGRALRIQEAHYGKDNFEVAITECGLAEALFNLGCQDDAISWLRHAKEILQRSCFEGHPELKWETATLDIWESQCAEEEEEEGEGEEEEVVEDDTEEENLEEGGDDNLEEARCV